MKTSKSIWGTVPRKTLIISLIGVFFTFSTIGFANDIIEMGRQPTLRFGLAISLTGLFSVWYAVYGNYSSEELVEGSIANLCHAILRDGLARQLVAQPARTNLDGRGRDRPFAKPADLRWYSHNICGGSGLHVLRLRLDCRGQALFPRACGDGAGRRDPPVLVPTIDIKSDGFEFYGRSLPSGEVGGDLVDVFQTDRGWIAYIADVSGHGVAPGRRYGHGQERRAHATLVHGRKRSAPRTPELGPYPHQEA